MPFDVIEVSWSVYEKITGKEAIPFVRYFVDEEGTTYKDTELDFNLDPPQPEATISGWVARDEGGGLYLHTIRPRKGAMEWHGDRQPLTLPLNSYPSLTWQDDPIEVEITIKPKKR